MEHLIDGLMLLINDSIRTDSPINTEKCELLINGSNVDDRYKLTLSSIVKAKKPHSKINRDLFDLKQSMLDEKKHIKSMKKFRNQEETEVLAEDFKKFEKYIYSVIHSQCYRSKASKTKVKVKLLKIHNLYGHDLDETRKDLFQEGKLYLWEGLKKYGVLPEKAKNFKSRGEGFERKIASKSTFVHTNLVRNLVNLSERSSSDKFEHTDIEYNPALIDREYLDD